MHPADAEYALTDVKQAGSALERKQRQRRMLMLKCIQSNVVHRSRQAVSKIDKYRQREELLCASLNSFNTGSQTCRKRGISMAPD